MIASSFVFATGVIDDRKELSASLKMAVQLGATLLVMCFGMVLRVLPEQLGFVSVIGNVFLTVLWIVGITNAMNFFDGMDGLAAGLGAIISFFLAIMAFQTSQRYLGWLSLSLMGGCLGFLPHNFRRRGRAFIFLGDAGSTTIGFVLASIAVYGDWAGKRSVVALVSPLLIFWILIFDMVHISIDRVVTGKVSTVKEWLEYVGRDHLHHRLAQVIGSNKVSVLFIYMLCICLGIGAVVLRHAGPLEAVLLVAQAFVLVLLITVLERRGRFGPRRTATGKTEAWKNLTSPRFFDRIIVEMRILRDDKNKGRSRESFANLYAELGGDRFRKPKTPAKVSRFSNMPHRLLPKRGRKESAPTRTRRRGAELYEKALAYMERSFGLLGRGKMFDLEEGRKLAGMLVESAAKGDALFLIAVHRQYGERHLHYHSVNTAILAAKLAGGLCLASQELEELGLAALLHAVGSIFVPEDIFYKDTP